MFLLAYLEEFLSRFIEKRVFAPVFRGIFSFFEWISNGITLRLMKRNIPPEDRVTLQPPESEEDLSRVMQSTQVVIWARWIRLRNRVLLLLSVSLLLVLIPWLFLHFIREPAVTGWVIAGSFFLFGCILITIAVAKFLPESRVAKELESHPEQVLAGADGQKKASGLVKNWNKLVSLMEKGDRKRGVFLALLGTALAGLLLFIFLQENVLTREVAPGVYEVRGLRYQLQEDGTARITGHGRIGANLEIPEKLGEARVTVIGEAAFSSCDGLRKVSLPAGVREIRAGAFSFCHNLAEVRLPDGLGEIRDKAFWWCDALETIRLPQGLKRLGADAFGGTRIRVLDLPEGLECLGAGSLDTMLLTRVTIPDSLRIIEGNPFNEAGGESIEIVISPDHPAFKVEDHQLVSRD